MSLAIKRGYVPESIYEAMCDEHGKVIAGGAALERGGYFIAPTIVRDIADDARLVREEQFGPVTGAPTWIVRFRWRSASPPAPSGSTSISTCRTTSRLQARSSQGLVQRWVRRA